MNSHLVIGWFQRCGFCCRTSHLVSPKRPLAKVRLCMWISSDLNRFVSVCFFSICGRPASSGHRWIISEPCPTPRSISILVSIFRSLSKEHAEKAKTQRAMPGPVYTSPGPGLSQAFSISLCSTPLPACATSDLFNHLVFPPQTAPIRPASAPVRRGQVTRMPNRPSNGRPVFVFSPCTVQDALMADLPVRASSRGMLPGFGFYLTRKPKTPNAPNRPAKGVAAVSQHK